MLAAASQRLYHTKRGPPVAAQIHGECDTKEPYLHGVGIPKLNRPGTGAIYHRVFRCCTSFLNPPTCSQGMSLGLSPSLDNSKSGNLDGARTAFIALVHFTFYVVRP